MCSQPWMGCGCGGDGMDACDGGGGCTGGHGLTLHLITNFHTIPAFLKSSH